jgi:Terpene cyclase DEP1
MENGLQLGLLVRQLFVNRISGFFGLDVLVSSVVLLIFMRVEGRMLRMRLR